MPERGAEAISELLRGEAVSKHFGGLRAVDEIDFHLDEGEILGLIGPNGAGKTTLFSVIAGSTAPTSGHVILDGKEIGGRSAHRVVHAGISRTHQIVRPFARLSVIDNVSVGALYGRASGKRMKTTRAARRLASELLEFIGLGDRAESLPGELTLANRKKIEVARALATEPRVLLLDEAVAGLNPVEAQRMVELIGKVRDRGTTIIMIEHMMRAVMGLSDRVMVLDHGKKIAEGTAREVADDPKVIEAYLGPDSGTGVDQGNGSKESPDARGR